MPAGAYIPSASSAGRPATPVVAAQNCSRSSMPQIAPQDSAPADQSIRKALIASWLLSTSRPWPLSKYCLPTTISTGVMNFVFHFTQASSTATESIIPLPEKKTGEPNSPYEAGLLIRLVSGPASSVTLTPTVSVKSPERLTLVFRVMKSLAL